MAKTKFITHAITKETFSWLSLLFGIFSLGAFFSFNFLMGCYYYGDDQIVIILAAISFLFGCVGLLSHRRTMALIWMVLSVIVILMSTILVCM